MKKIEEFKKNLIVDLEYGQNADIINPYSYEARSEKEKKEYKLNSETGYYYKDGIIPDLSNEDLMLIMAEANYKNIKTIKNCAIFFTILAVISLVVSLLASCSLTL